MNIWRLIAHHEKFDEAVEQMESRNLIAIGWSDIGDLRERDPRDASAIAALIAKHHPNAPNASLGGPSLWNLFREMKKGDLAIVAADGRRHFVMTVIGDYFYSGPEAAMYGYRHQRSAVITPLDPDKLWKSVGAGVAEGQNHMWTLARCSPAPEGAVASYVEGERYEIRSTAIERNARARDACIKAHGSKCFVCDFDFARTYGRHGAGYIHVHHRIALAHSSGPREVDPVQDLVPLCPNCHAMVHRGGRLLAPETLKELMAKAAADRGEPRLDVAAIEG